MTCCHMFLHYYNTNIIISIFCNSVGCGNTIGAIPSSVYRTLESALTAKDKAERDLKMYTNLVCIICYILY